MAVTKDQLESFYHFANNELSANRSDLTLDQIYQTWRLENPTPEEQADVHIAIRQGIEDIKAGRGRPAEEVMEEMREKYNIPAE